MHAGLDVELPWALSYGQLENIVHTSGRLTEDDITTSAKRVLEQKLRFKADKKTGKVGIGSPITKYRNSRISCNGPHLALAEKAAIESMVLLKNDSNTLPIPSSVTKLAVVGATVPYETDNGGPIKTGGKVNFATDIRTGDLGSSRVFFDPAKAIGPFAGICRAAGGTVNGTTCENSQGVTVTTATNNERRSLPGHGGRGRRRFRRRDGGPDRAGRGRGVHEGRRSRQRLQARQLPGARRETEGRLREHPEQR